MIYRFKVTKGWEQTSESIQTVKTGPYHREVRASIDCIGLAHYSSFAEKNVEKTHFYTFHTFD